MRLLDVSAVVRDGELFSCQDFLEPPAYAILSHTWGQDEVLFEDLNSTSARDKHGYQKLKYAAQQAALDGLRYVWIDTCCIDKSSSTELQEAINSMFRWYRQAARCYVYLEDVDLDTKHEDFPAQFSLSRWFTRGWTLQELLASQNVKYFSKNWQSLHVHGEGEDVEATGRDYSAELLELTSSITGIDMAFLRTTDRLPLSSASIATRMHWASCRETTRPEDIAYCLMGIFNINMPLLYGEGKHAAFTRLQTEIMKNSDDHSLFGWKVPYLDSDTTGHGLLADDPSFFKEVTSAFQPKTPRSWAHADLYSLTRKGLSIQLPLREWTTGLVGEDLYVAALDCKKSPGIYLRRLKEKDCYTRVRCNQLAVHFDRVRCDQLAVELDPGPTTPIYVREGAVEVSPQHFRSTSPAFRITADEPTQKLYSIFAIPDWYNRDSVISGSDIGTRLGAKRQWQTLESEPKRFWLDYFDLQQRTANFVLQHNITGDLIMIAIALLPDNFAYTSRISRAGTVDTFDMRSFYKMTDDKINTSFQPMYLAKGSWYREKGGEWQSWEPLQSCKDGHLAFEDSSGVKYNVKVSCKGSYFRRMEIYNLHFSIERLEPTRLSGDSESSGADTHLLRSNPRRSLAAETDSEQSIELSRTLACSSLIDWLRQLFQKSKPAITAVDKPLVALDSPFPLEPASVDY